jgi:hypothetical protein
MKQAWQIYEMVLANFMKRAWQISGWIYFILFYFISVTCLKFNLILSIGYL